ncbi:hypothetical protein [Burkholderia arboris]|uniref:hypothetical protein n=1 Tax=Burkholderia arboris TaxID=488730 RepID=UPI0030F31FB7
MTCLRARFSARHSAFAQQRADREKHQKGILIDFMTTIENDVIQLGTSVIRQELLDDARTIVSNSLQQVFPVHFQSPADAGTPCARRARVCGATADAEAGWTEEEIGTRYPTRSCPEDTHRSDASYRKAIRVALVRIARFR